MNAVRQIDGHGKPQYGKPVKNPVLLEAFGKRLWAAADASPHVPPSGEGRYPWLRDEFANRFNVVISSQAIGKWFVGENMPTPTKLEMLAEILGVDAGWLGHGRETVQNLQEGASRSAIAAGCVNLVAGMIQTDGGMVAFPKEDSDEPKMAKGMLADKPHLHAIIRGARYDFFVAVGEQTDAGWRFLVPRRRDALVMLGLIRYEGFHFEVFEIPEEVLTGQGRFHRGATELVVKDPAAVLRPVTSFSGRL